MDAGACRPFVTISATSLESPGVARMRSSAGARGLAAGVEFLPAVECARHARRDLRVEGVERDHLLGEKVVAAAVGRMEAHVVAGLKPPISAYTLFGLRIENAGCA